MSPVLSKLSLLDCFELITLALRGSLPKNVGFIGPLLNFMSRGSDCCYDTAFVKLFLPPSFLEFSGILILQNAAANSPPEPFFAAFPLTYYYFFPKF